MPENCALCNSPELEGSDFCELHQKARLSLGECYEIWLRAYDEELSMQSYLQEILKLQETGQAVKELAAHLLKSRSIDDEGHTNNL